MQREDVSVAMRFGGLASYSVLPRRLRIVIYRFRMFLDLSFLARLRKKVVVQKKPYSGRFADSARWLRELKEWMRQREWWIQMLMKGRNGRADV
jgi:hypothetical protein